MLSEHCSENLVFKILLRKSKNVVDGIILVDLPFEEEKSIKNLLDKNNIHYHNL